MKTFRDYLAEAEETFDRPRVGDNFAITCREECLLETWVCDETDDGVVLHADDRMLNLLEGYGYLSEDIDDDMAKAQDQENQIDNEIEDEMSEAKYQGRTVPLGKPMAGDVKKSKVYVKGPKGNVVKVNFGQKGMKIKKSIPGRRKNFRARHNCDNPGPRWKARYWSCRAW